MPDPRSVSDRLEVAPEVRDALAAGRAVVALESTLISHGLPYPQNLDVARASESAVRASGAVAATVAIHDGRLLVGLDAGRARGPGHRARRVGPQGRPTEPRRGARRRWMGGHHRVGDDDRCACRRDPGLRHGRDRRRSSGRARWLRWLGGRPATFDVSSDLEELASTPMAVVCAGPKAILDVPATLEYLETRGVPVIVVGQDELPGFFARSAGIRAPASVADVRGAADVVAAQLGLGLRSGILVCIPVPPNAALSDDVAREAVERAVHEAGEAGITGPALTPWLLARIAAHTEGASIRANTALIVNNAAIAGELAVLLGG